MRFIPSQRARDCRGVEANMSGQTIAAPSVTVCRVPLLAVCAVITAVFGCSIYANLSLAVAHRADYRFFPPFLRNVDANDYRGLAGENCNIAQSLVDGKGFEHPFNAPAGPTAWMPPVLPTILAALLWVWDGDRDRVAATVIFLQVFVVIGTGLLVLMLVRQTARRVGSGGTVAVFLALLLCHFQMVFQGTQDHWLMVLAVDLLVAGLCWLRPLGRWWTAAGWGLFGGLCGLTNPIIGATWALLSLVTGFRQRAWSRLALAVFVALLTLTPWTVRNYLVFGRLIPVKSNLAYELYQSQCLQPDGLIQRRTFHIHPYTATTREGREYKQLGERAFLDHKRMQFWQAVAADPADFLKRVGQRFLGATLWYEPFDRAVESKRPWTLWLNRLIHPLPFLALLMLAGSAFRERLHAAQWTAIGVYLVYLLPYVGVSYY